MIYAIFLTFFVVVQCRSISYDSALGYRCEENSHCTGLVSNAVCLNKRCVCRFGYKANGIFRCVPTNRSRRQIQFESSTVQMLGEECQSDDQCRRTPVDGSKLCFINQCQCSSGYVPIDAYRCIPDFEQLTINEKMQRNSDVEPPGFGSICTKNDDCRHPMVQFECLRGSCSCLEGSVPLGKYLCYNVDGQSETEVQISTTIPLDVSNDEKTKNLGRLGSNCTENYYCRRVVSQSHCYNGKCSCLDGFVSHDSFHCVESKEENLSEAKIILGASCSNTEQCRANNAICLNQICSCSDNYFPIDEWTCLKDSDTSEEEITTSSSTTSTTTTKTTTSVFLWWPWSSSTSTTTTTITRSSSKETFRYRCLLNRQCASIDANSHCTLFGRCICNTGYKLQVINDEQHCVPEIKLDDDCD